MATLNTSTFDKLAKRFNYGFIKPFQKAVIQSIIEQNNDTFVCAKTGSGKSLCFQGLAYLCSELCMKENPIVLVISPLISLMETQVKELLDRQISATYIGKDSSENGDILRGKYSYVFSNPENVTSGVWRDMLRSSIYRKNLVCIVFDEVHTAVSWGLDKKAEEAFRPEFARVGELRSMISNIPMLALTATASPPVRAKIQRLLAMKTPLEIVESPDRENIIISVIKVPVQLEAAFKWIVDLMNRDQKNCMKVIIYCKRIQDCSKLYMYFTDEVKERELFDMYHSRTTDKVKSKILSTIKEPNSTLRIIIATNAVGMGLDFQSNHVIHYGPPSEYDAYLQQIGRVGRDGSVSHAMLLYHSQQLRKVSPEMLSFVKGDNCRRKIVRQLYGDKTLKTVEGCRCCDVCKQGCKCGNCIESANPFKLNIEGAEAELGLERYVSDEDSHRVEIHLLSLKNELDREVSRYSTIESHGLTKSSIKLLVEKAAYIFDVDTILDSFGNFSRRCGTKDLKCIFSCIW